MVGGNELLSVSLGYWLQPCDFVTNRVYDLFMLYYVVVVWSFG